MMLNTISKKELYGRLLALEAKTDLILERNETRRHMFQRYVYIVIFFEILNIAMAGMIMIKLMYEFR